VEFSYSIFAATVLLVILSGLIALLEGTFRNEEVTMGFVNHGGMWGDTCILSTVNGIVFPYLSHNFFAVAVILAVSGAVTIFAHAQWGKFSKKDGRTCHMFPYREEGPWYLRISLSGWFHVVTMTLLLAVLLIYTFSSGVPGNVVWWVSILTTVHVFLGTLQPEWYCNRRLTRQSLIPSLTATGLIWVIAIIKLA